MISKATKNRAWLLATAKTIAKQLQARSRGTRLRIRVPSSTKSTDTDGWRAIIGHLGKNQPQLEVWFDRFSRYPDRKLYAGFRADVRAQITAITKRVARHLWPTRVITSADTQQEKFLALAKRLARSEFSAPVLENYHEGLTWYGIYDPTKETTARATPHFCARAVGFFEDVARALPNAKAEDEQREGYPQIENRKLVASHHHRERSKLLATECKIHHDYKCQVCGLRFEDAYGRLGGEFAEAHHLIPLSRLRENVRTRIEDLTTVCANCHRMLHRMEGHRDDIKKLKTIIRNHR